MKTTTIRNPQEIKKEFEDISIVAVEQAFKQFTTHFLVYYEDEFEMVTNSLGILRDSQNSIRMRVYTFDPYHDSSMVMVVKTFDDEIQDEVESISWQWQNLVTI